MGEMVGVALAIVSSCLGGAAGAVTRYLVADASPITLALLRWGIGALIVAPLALMLGARWPGRGDLMRVAGLGVMFFGLFFIFYNIAMIFTTAARASLALSTLPLQTMAAAAALGAEPVTRRKALGVGIAMSGAVLALAADLPQAPAGAWRGELIMFAAVLCMAFYNVFSRPFIQRSSALGFLAVGMAAGAAALALAGGLTGSVAELQAFGPAQWRAAFYLGLGGGALAFILWVMALARTTPTRVAITMTFNPVTAGLLANALIDEPITPALGLGLIAVLAGVWIAVTERRVAET